MAELAGKIGKSRTLDTNAATGLGKISGTSQKIEPSYGSLDEPVLETILRDVRRVAVKLKHVMLPQGTIEGLRDWDLWGPLILCLALASTLSISAREDQTGLVFGVVFVIVWCGAGIVTINAVLLGGTISFFQSVCVLGYCLFPFNIASFLCLFGLNNFLQFAVVAGAFFWASRASVTSLI